MSKATKIFCIAQLSLVIIAFTSDACINAIALSADQANVECYIWMGITILSLIMTISWAIKEDK